MSKSLLIPTRDLWQKKVKNRYLAGDVSTINTKEVIDSIGPEYGFEFNYSAKLGSSDYDPVRFFIICDPYSVSGELPVAYRDWIDFNRSDFGIHSVQTGELLINYSNLSSLYEKGFNNFIVNGLYRINDIRKNYDIVQLFGVHDDIDNNINEYCPSIQSKLGFIFKNIFISFKKLKSYKDFKIKVWNDEDNTYESIPIKFNDYEFTVSEKYNYDKEGKRSDYYYDVPTFINQVKHHSRINKLILHYFLSNWHLLSQSDLITDEFKGDQPKIGIYSLFSEVEKEVDKKVTWSKLVINESRKKKFEEDKLSDYYYKYLNSLSTGDLRKLLSSVPISESAPFGVYSTIRYILFGEKFGLLNNYSGISGYWHDHDVPDYVKNFPSAFIVDHVYNEYVNKSKDRYVDIIENYNADDSYIKNQINSVLPDEKSVEKLKILDGQAIAARMLSYEELDSIKQYNNSDEFRKSHIYTSHSESYINWISSKLINVFGVANIRHSGTFLYRDNAIKDPTVHDTELINTFINNKFLYFICYEFAYDVPYGSDDYGESHEFSGVLRVYLYSRAASIALGYKALFSRFKQDVLRIEFGDRIEKVKVKNPLVYRFDRENSVTDFVCLVSRFPIVLTTNDVNDKEWLKYPSMVPMFSYHDLSGRLFKLRKNKAYVKGVSSIIHDKDIMKSEIISGSKVSHVSNDSLTDNQVFPLIISNRIFADGRKTVFVLTDNNGVRSFGYDGEINRRFDLSVNGSIFNRLKDNGPIINIKSKTLKVNRDIIKEIDKIDDIDVQVKRITSLSDSNSFYYSFPIKKKNVDLILKKVTVDDNVEELMDDVDTLMEGSNFQELFYSFVTNKAIETDSADFSDERFITASTKLFGMEPFSDEMLDYINSEEFAKDFTFDGIKIIDTESFTRFINLRSNAIDVSVINTAADFVKVSAEEVNKVVSSLNSILSFDSNGEGYANKGKEVAQAANAFNTINDGIQKIINPDVSDTASVKLMKARATGKISSFDVSLSDPNLILLDWKYRMLNNFKEYKFIDDGSNSNISRFNDLIENLGIPVPDFSRIGELISAIFSGIPKFLSGTIKAAAGALAIWDNLYNIINIVRFPVKVGRPNINYNSKNNTFDFFMVVPHDIMFNKSMFNNSELSFMNLLNFGFLTGQNSVTTVRYTKVYIPELKYVTGSVVISVPPGHIDNFLEYYYNVQKDNKLSELSKFISILMYDRRNVFMDLSVGDHAWMSGIVTMQATLAAGAAFVSSKDVISGGISAAISGSITYAVNAAEYGLAAYNSDSYFSDWFITDDPDNMQGVLIGDERIVVLSIRNASALPMTPLYIAGSVMVEVIKIVGAFALAAVLGAAVGHIVRKIQNYMKLRAKRKELLSSKKQLQKQMNAEIKEVNEKFKKDKDLTVPGSPEWKEFSKKNLIAQREKVKLKYASMEGGIINMNRTQLRGLANYNLFLDDNGILNGSLLNKGLEVSRKQMAVVAAAAGVSSSVISNVLGKTTELIKNKDSGNLVKDKNLDEKEIFKMIIGL